MLSAIFMRMCVCKLTPAAGTGEAEPAGTGEAWRWDELARSLSHSGLDRNGLCRRPEPRHMEPPNNAPHIRMTMREKADCPQLSRGGCHDWDSVKCNGRKSGGKYRQRGQILKQRGQEGDTWLGTGRGSIWIAGSYSPLSLFEHVSGVHSTLGDEWSCLLQQDDKIVFVGKEPQKEITLFHHKDEGLCGDDHI